MLPTRTTEQPLLWRPLLIGLLVIASGMAVCPSSANEVITTKHYMRFVEQRVNWMSAVLHCARQNMTLATVASAADQALAVAIIDAPAAGATDPIDHFWMGANNQHNEAEFAWIGSGQPVAAYHNWADSFPRPGGGQCVFVQRQLHTWCTNTCDRRAYVLCEYYAEL